MNELMNLKNSEGVQTYSLESVMLVNGAICWIEGGGDEARDPCLDDILLDDKTLGLFMSLVR